MCTHGAIHDRLDRTLLISAFYSQIPLDLYIYNEVFYITNASIDTRPLQQKPPLPLYVEKPSAQVAAAQSARKNDGEDVS